jgi:hypothetical protein
MTDEYLQPCHDWLKHSVLCELKTLGVCYIDWHLSMTDLFLEFHDTIHQSKDSAIAYQLQALYTWNYQKTSLDILIRCMIEVTQLSVRNQLRDFVCRLANTKYAENHLPNVMQRLSTTIIPQKLDLMLTLANEMKNHCDQMRNEFQTFISRNRNNETSADGNFHRMQNQNRKEWSQYHLKVVPKLITQVRNMKNHYFGDHLSGYGDIDVFAFVRNYCCYQKENEQWLQYWASNALYMNGIRSDPCEDNFYFISYALKNCGELQNKFIVISFQMHDNDSTSLVKSWIQRHQRYLEQCVNLSYQMIAMRKQSRLDLPNFDKISFQGDMILFWRQELISMVHNFIVSVNRYCSYIVLSCLVTYIRYPSNDDLIERLMELQSYEEMIDLRLQSIRVQQSYLAKAVQKRIEGCHEALENWRYLLNPPFCSFISETCSPVSTKMIIMRLNLMLIQVTEIVNHRISSHFFQYAKGKEMKALKRKVGMSAITTLQYLINGYTARYDNTQQNLGLDDVERHNILLGELMAELFIRFLNSFPNGWFIEEKHCLSFQQIMDKLEQLRLSWITLHGILMKAKNITPKKEIEHLQNKLEIELLISSLSMAAVGRLYGTGKIDDNESGEPISFFAVEINSGTNTKSQYQQLFQFVATWFDSKELITFLLESLPPCPTVTTERASCTNIELIRVFDYWFRASLHFFQLQIEEAVYKAPVPVVCSFAMRNRVSPLISPPAEDMTMVTTAMDVLLHCKPYIEQQLFNNILEEIPSQYATPALIALLENHANDKVKCVKMFEHVCQLR